MRGTIWLAISAISLARGQSGKGAAPVVTPDAQGEAQRIAIVVGVSDYPDDAGLSNLPFAQNDARDVAAALKRLGYIVNLMPNARASAIVHEIRETRKLIAGTNSTLLFYYSGHGASDGNHENYLMTYGAGRERLEKEALSVLELENELRNTKAQRQVIWIDACRTMPEPGRKSPPEVETFSDMKAARGIRILLATSFGESSWEYPELKHGAFTYQLLRALEPGSPAYRDDGVITFTGLYRFVRNETMKWTYEHHHIQVPVENGSEMTGDFLLGSAPMGKAPTVPVSDQLKAAKEALDRKDYPVARAGFEALAHAGNAEAQYELGLMHREGEGVPKSDVEGMRWIRMAAEQRLAAAQTSLGYMIREGRGAPRDNIEALKWFRLAASQGNAAGQANLGYMYLMGLGVAKDPVEAAKWFRLGAEQGSTDAEANLGSLYEDGKGVKQDYAEAMKWFRLAGDQGSAAAQSNIGWLYDNGLGVAPNKAEAAKWYRLASDQGEPAAQSNLGVLYRTGAGVPKNDVEAAKWYRLSANQGNAIAQNNLAYLYENGLGVPKSIPDALKWYKLAAAQGHEDAKKSVERLSGAR